MGLADREYMRERTRARFRESTTWNDKRSRVELDPASGGFRCRTHPAQKWIFLISALAMLIPFYREAKREGWIPDPQPALEFPQTGSVTVHKSVNPRRATSSLLVQAGGANAVVQLYDVATGLHVISVYVARERSARVSVPPGTYRVALVEGGKWHGRQRYFGASTTYDTVAEPMVFERDTGHGISLIRRPNGNLRTASNVRSPAPLD